MNLLLLSFFVQDPCVIFAGKSEIVIREDTQAQVVLCNIGDERVALETLQKEASGVTTQVVDHFLSDEERVSYTDPGGWIIQPSYGYCALQLKGTDVRVIDATGGQSGLCMLGDESLISDWTMFRGKSHASKPDLYELIKNLRHLSTPSPKTSP